jgi:hypothetical protein
MLLLLKGLEPTGGKPEEARKAAIRRLDLYNRPCPADNTLSVVNNWLSSHE